MEPFGTSSRVAATATATGSGSGCAAGCAAGCATGAGAVGSRTFRRTAFEPKCL